MRLAAAVPAIRLEKHTKKREWKSGADWEVWAGRPGGFIGLRVQAKILSSSGDFPAYKSLFPSKAKATAQVEKLIVSAESAPRRMFPVFAFYNSLPYGEGQFASIPCPRVSQTPLLCGWTVASAYALRARLYTLPSKHLHHLVDLMLPFTCIFCCPATCGLAGAGTTSLAERVAMQVRRTWPEDPPGEGDLVHATGPIYVERLYKGERAETGWGWLPMGIRELMAPGRELPGGVSRVLIVRDEPFNEGADTENRGLTSG